MLLFNFFKNFLTFPGTADDNVHFQQSMVLTRALVDYNILFRLQVKTENKKCLNMFKSCRLLFIVFNQQIKPGIVLSGLMGVA